MADLHYFGTDLRSHGHYFWDLDGDSMRSSKLDFKDLPFNPESVPEYEGKHNMGVKGDAQFHQREGWSIWAINGSAVDTRWGTRSVFFTPQTIGPDKLKALILAQPMAARLIEQMPFKVKW